ncbi:hypothetical protein [Novosphingobium naphthalenivorans]|uniref:hypothetical protein n=1 Tax=Novosphingobium naphthalenivorans TaxID=273168 RepID=UPI00083586FA|nr:hypothetical protein [Novosphingobium naphthalenivorans]
MKPVAIAGLSVLLLGAAPAAPSAQFGESCSGSETVKVGTAAPKTLPYHLDFSADLALDSYSYGQCLPNQSYRIADPASHPLKLADLDRAGQVRHIAFDRAAGRITDYQIFDSPLGRIERKASGTCKPAPFHPVPQAE